MYSAAQIKKAFKIMGFSEYEIIHIINLLKETKNDRKAIKQSAR
jgi:hypothetical protein